MYNFNDVRKNENKGFSLVELIVVIAIMAVMTSVLAPALLQYVERSRAQKDDSAMGEVTNAIMLALSDQNIYDEVLFYACKYNYSCYVDSESPSDEVEASNADVTMYGDLDRQKDEVIYYVDGKMRGVTITFFPSPNTNKSEFDLGAAAINAFIRPENAADANVTAASSQNAAGDFVLPTSALSGQTYYTAQGPAYATVGTLETMTNGSGNNYLYNRVRSVIGDTVELTSQTYRNSNYTVFIRIGSTGGNQADAQDAIKVYGQWNGTNLMAG